MTASSSHLPEPTKFWTGFAVDAGLDRDRLAGLSLQPAEQAADDERGVGPLLGAVEARQIASQEGRDPVLTAADLVGGHDGIRQESLGVGMFQERHGGPSRRSPLPPIITPVRSMQ